jgi:7-carboxy-7-deazaguanine synthase
MRNPSDATVEICETFVSVQGESTFAGLICHFIRLSRCNLRCSYCDTAHAFGPGTPRSVEELVAEESASGAAIAEITGGEPLLQPAFARLALALRDSRNRPVLVETNGSQDLALVPEGVTAIMDVKCPGSGEAASLRRENLGRLRSYDEVKFVLSDRVDYEWARQFVLEHALASRCRAVLLGAVWGRLDARLLASWIVADRLPVRLQVQLHKVLEVR